MWELARSPRSHQIMPNLGKSWQDFSKISQDLSKIFQDLGKIIIRQDLTRSFMILQDLVRFWQDIQPGVPDTHLTMKALH